MRPELKMFAQYMEHKLKLNDHKGGWEQTSIPVLFKRLREELHELEQAISTEPELNIMMEAADVANFAMMIAWNAAKDGFLIKDNAKSVENTKTTVKSARDTDPSAQMQLPFDAEAYYNK